MTLSKKEKAAEMFWTPEEWREAYKRAAELVGMPPRGKRGSKANKIRQRLGSAVATRARRILWAQRALRINEGLAVGPAGNGTIPHA